MLRWLVFLGIWISAVTVSAQEYRPSREKPAVLPREFRGAWAACVYNIDWPSRKGLSAGAQQAELRRILDKMASLNMNALIFQVRPNADAVYRSSIEPWSPWLTGTMGKSPGYDPLAYCISQAHARGIEVHVWFNPFRALPNASQPASSNHVSRTHPSVIKRFKISKWMDPSSSFTRSRALTVMMDVVKRYDIDGLHIDDYFYPYPDVDKQGRAKQQFPDGKSASQRRAAVDGFVKDMYKTVKAEKPWVRVGISPFGIWKPGVPRGVEAKINAYEHLAADSRKWLRNGWCDYLSPQLYWRVQGPQSYSSLLSWWRKQGRRPVWPGIATSRIKSSEDPGRPASEIIRQVNLSRTTGKNWVGHVHWSVKALMQNRGGVSSGLQREMYRYPALVPPMPWLSKAVPPSPSVRARGGRDSVQVSWGRVPAAAKYAVQVRGQEGWYLAKVLPAGASKLTLNGAPLAVAVSAIDRYGTASKPTVLAR